MIRGELANTRGKNADELLAAPFKVHVSWCRCEYREISSKSHVLAGCEFCASLPDNDRSGIYPLASETLHTKPFTGAIVDILC